MKSLPHVGAIRLGHLYTVGLTGQRAEVLALSPAIAKVKLLDLGRVVDVPVSLLRPLPAARA
jgi:hypothetical protein